MAMTAIVMVMGSMDVMEMIIETMVIVPEKVEVAPLEHRLGCIDASLARKERRKRSYEGTGDTEGIRDAPLAR
jgi:hypothetical protein